jgi:hypothetical protein
VKEGDRPIRVRVAGVDGLRLLIHRKSFAEPVHLVEGPCLVHNSRQVVRSQGKRPLEPRQGLRVAPKTLQHPTDIVAYIGIIRVECLRPRDIGESVLIPVKTEFCERPHMQCRRAIGPQRIADVETGKGFLKPSRLKEQRRRLVRGLPFGGIERDRLLIARERLIQTIHLLQNKAEVFPGLGSIGLELHGLIECLESLFKPARALKHDAEAYEIFRVWLLSDGADHPLHGEIVLSGVERHQAHQMLGARIARIDFESLPAAKLRIQISFGAEMNVASFAKRSKLTGAARSRLGFLGRSPAFTAVHWRSPPATRQTVARRP